MSNTLVFFNCPDAVVDNIRNGLADSIPTKVCHSWDDVRGLMLEDASHSFMAQLPASRQDLHNDFMNSVANQGTHLTIERRPVRGIVSDNDSQENGSHGNAEGVDPNTEVGGKLAQRIDECERRIITDTLQRNHNHRNQTAAELGISRVTLYNKMKKLGLL